MITCFTHQRSAIDEFKHQENIYSQDSFQIQQNLSKISCSFDKPAQLPFLLNMIQNDSQNDKLYQQVSHILKLKQLQVPSTQFFAKSLFDLSKIQVELKDVQNDLVKYRKLVRVRGFSSRHLRCFQTFRNMLSDVQVICQFSTHEFIESYKSATIKSQQLGFQSSSLVAMNSSSYMRFCYQLINLKQRAARIVNNSHKTYEEALLYIQSDNLVSIFSAVLIGSTILISAAIKFQEFDTKIQEIISQIMSSHQPITKFTDLLKELNGENKVNVQNKQINDKKDASNKETITFDDIMKKNKSRGFKSKDKWW